jgi:dihydroflavonol-4-reductase
MEPQRALVMGASGFLGSHVVRRLVERGDDVRVYLRTTSSTRGIDGLDLERCYGDLGDVEALRAAMAGRDVVYYCVVDTRAWLRDPAPLFATNVEALRGVLDVARAANLHKFVFTSTIGTIAIGQGVDSSPVDEDTPFDWDGKGGPYVESRRQAEELVLRHARERGLPAVAMCVSNTYGPGDWQPTPHGGMIAAAALGKMPGYVRGVAAEVVGVEDAAQALLLAADHGRVGERYIVSESYQSMQTLFETAADETGVRAPRFGVPLPVLYAVGFVGSIVGRLLRRDTPVTLTSVRLLRFTSPLDHGKATRELGWEPRPTTEAVRRAARFFTSVADARAGHSRR